MTTEAVLSRFTRTATTRPTRRCWRDRPGAESHLGIACYLRDRGLQREIEEGLNVVEAWNGANTAICYGRSGEISTNRREEAEMTALCLRIPQAALVYVNTLMLQDVLAGEAWSGLLGEADRRGLTPLFWQHVPPYGEVRLDKRSRLRLSQGQDPGGAAAGAGWLTGPFRLIPRPQPPEPGRMLLPEISGHGAGQSAVTLVWGR